MKPKRNCTYSFFKREEGYVLTVVCGGITIFTISIRLNNFELKEFLNKGESYINELAYYIYNSPSLFAERNLEKIS